MVLCNIIHSFKNIDMKSIQRRTIVINSNEAIKNL